MARHKDQNWDLPIVSTWDGTKTAVLMDIRDELKCIRASQMLQCDVAWAIKAQTDLLKSIRNLLKKKRKRGRGQRRVKI